MKTEKIIYWITTGIVSVAMLFSAFMYLSRNDELLKGFEAIGLPLYLVTLLGVAKLIGAALLIAPVPVRFKEWTYAGFLFTFGGAIWAHIATATLWIAPLVFLVLLSVSYVYWNKVTQAAS